MKLSEYLKSWRADRPDEWKMDEFIRAAEHLEAEVERFSGCGDAVGEVVNKFGDPKAFAERELKITTDIQTLPIGTKLYTHPSPDCYDHLHKTIELLTRQLVKTERLQAPAPAVPDGYTLVPDEPTEVMFDALCNTPWVIEGSIEGNCFVTKEFPNQRYVLDGWKAMLEAAQKENDR
jgi:hypothetical protein